MSDQCPGENLTLLLSACMKMEVEEPSPTSDHKKCVATSRIHREDGDCLFENGMFDPPMCVKMLTEYSQSLALAPPDSPEIIEIYNCRSRLLYTVGKYEHCLEDVEKALRATKSQAERIKFLCRKATCLKEINDEQRAILVLSTAEDLIDLIEDEALQRKMRQMYSATEGAELGQPKTTVEISLPNMSKSKEIPDVSDAVGLVFGEQYGRYLMANRDIKTGELLILEDGYVTCPASDKLFAICDYCLCPAWSAISCENCIYSIYCSEQCKSLALEKYHDLECPIIDMIYERASFFENVDFSFRNLRIVVRVILAAVKEGGNRNFEFLFQESEDVVNSKDLRTKGFTNCGQFSSQKIRSLLSLPSEQLEIDSVDYFSIAKEILMILRKAVIDIPDPTPAVENEKFEGIIKLIIKLSMLVKKYSQMFETYECTCEVRNTRNSEHDESCLSDLGTIITPVSFLINHSCNANLMRIFAQGKVLHFAKRPIKKGDQLLVSYGLPFTKISKTERQALLKTSFGLICNCEACIGDWPSDSTNHEAENTYKAWVKSQFGNSDTIPPICEWKNRDEVLESLIRTIDQKYEHGESIEAAVKTEVLTDLLAEYYCRVYGKYFDFPPENELS